MAGNEKAATAGDRHGSNGIEAGTSYCPRPRRRRQREKLLDNLLAHDSVTTHEARDYLGMMSPVDGAGEAALKT